MGLLNKNEVTAIIDLKPSGIEAQKNGEVEKGPFSPSGNSVRRDFEQYAGEATIHGLRFLSDVKSALIRRLIWLALVLTAFTVSSYEILLTVSGYFEYGVTTTARQVYVQEIPFPAVTICNFNKYRLSYTTNNTNFSQWLYEVYSPTNINYYKIPPNGELVDDINRTEVMLEAAHQKEKMILFCTWKGENCGPGNFTTSFTDFGVCYTFNGDPENVLTVDIPGLSSALELQLDLEATESNYGNGYLEGFVTAIHNQDEPPNIRYRGGIYTATGRQSVVSLQRIEIISLSSPYSTQCLASGTKYQTRYSQSQCYNEKAAVLSEEVCGCIEPYMPGTARICNFNESYYCIETKIPDMVKNECRDVPCQNIVFLPQVSTAKLPSSDILGELAQLTGSDPEVLKENYAGLSVFYSSMSYEEIKETPRIVAPDLIGEVGGIMGFCLGASFLSIYEFWDFLVVSFWKRYTHKTNNK